MLFYVCECIYIIYYISKNRPLRWKDEAPKIFLIRYGRVVIISVTAKENKPLRNDQQLCTRTGIGKNNKKDRIHHPSFLFLLLRLSSGIFLNIFLKNQKRWNGDIPLYNSLQGGLLLTANHLCLGTMSLLAEKRTAHPIHWGQSFQRMAAQRLFLYIFFCERFCRLRIRQREPFLKVSSGK